MNREEFDLHSASISYDNTDRLPFKLQELSACAIKLLSKGNKAVDLDIENLIRKRQSLIGENNLDRMTQKAKEFREQYFGLTKI